MSKQQAQQPLADLTTVDSPASKRARVKDVPVKTRKNRVPVTHRHTMLLRSHDKARVYTLGAAERRREELQETPASPEADAVGDNDEPSNVCTAPPTIVPSQAFDVNTKGESVYKPLNPSRREIRLVTLHEGRFSGNICCSLSTVSLDDDPAYEALSYAWGDPSIMRPTSLDGTLHQATTNLEAALRYLRYADRPRVLWVDALCINQKETTERSHQVLLMGEVFRNASAVLAWLGEASDDSGLAFDAFETWPRTDEIHWDPSESPGMDTRTSGIEYARAVRKLFERPYFRRLWIVQEIVLGKTIPLICGNGQIYADVVFDVSRCHTRHVLHCSCLDGRCLQFSTALSAHLCDFYSFKSLRDTAGEIGEDYMAWPLIRFMDQACSDPRDKVYGLLGLINGAIHIMPDYTVPMSTAYEQSTLATIEQSHNLDILTDVLPASAVASTKNSANLPSWVPNWAAVATRGGNLTVFKDRVENLPWYRSSSGTTHIMKRSAPGRLALQGVLLGSIAELGDHPTYGKHSLKLLNHIEAWKRVAMSDQRGSRLYPNGSGIAKTSAATCSRLHPVIGGSVDILEPVVSSGAGVQTTYLDAFWMTLCGSIMPDNNPGGPMPSFRIREPYRYRSYFESWWKYWSKPPGRSSPVNKEFVSCYLRILDATIARTLFRSDSRHEWLGSAPVDAKVGDKIAILAGGRVPYILRQKELDGERVFQFIGDAYVHGLMDGEGMALGELEEIILV